MDIEKLINGHRQIVVKGKCNTEDRRKLAEEAIGYFQANPKPTRKEYFGIKNYDSFGDQRSDHGPCYGPKHGSIMFSIDYRRDNFWDKNLKGD